MPAVVSTVAAAATAALPTGYRAAMLEFRILGPLEVVGSAGPVQLGGPKQRATLAILLLNASRVVSIDALADQLYAGRPPVTAATQVHRQISELRKILGEEARIETRSPGYLIHVASEQLDLKRFERLTEEAGNALARGEAAAALEPQREALSLWRGPALADLDHEPFAEIAPAAAGDPVWSHSSSVSTPSSPSAANGSSLRSSGSWSRSIPERAVRVAGSCSPCTDPGARQRLSTSTGDSGEARRRLRDRARSCPP